MNAAVTGLSIAVVSLLVLSCLLIAAVVHQYRETSALNRRVDEVRRELLVEVKKVHAAIPVVQPIDPPPRLNFNR